MRPNGTWKLFIALSAAVTILVAVWAGITRLKHVTSDAEHTAKELASLKESLQTIANERSRTTVVYQAPRIETGNEVPPVASVSATPAPVPATPEDPLKGLPPDEKHYRLGVINEAQAKLVSAALEQEPADPSWSNSAAQLLRSTYQGEEFAGANISAACKSTICKVSLTSNDALQGETVLRKMLQKQAWPTNGFAGFDREKREGYMYVAREGTELPRVDPASLKY